MARTKSGVVSATTKTRARKAQVFAVKLEGTDGTTEMKLVRAMSKKAAKSAVVGKVTVEIASADDLVQAGREGAEIVDA